MKYFSAILFALFFLPFCGFSQIENLEELSLEQCRDLLKKRTNILLNQKTSGALGEDDLLRGLRNDSYMTGSWGLIDSTEYSYDGELLIETINKVYNNTTWDLANRSTYEYNSDDQLIVILSQEWNGTAWQYTSRFDIEYNENGYTTIFARQDFDGVAWVNGFLLGYEYNPDGLILKTYTQLGNGSTWDNFNQSIHEYNSNDLLESVLDQRWKNMEWVNNTQSTFEYETGNIRKTTAAYWNLISSEWNYINRKTEAFDANDYLLSSLTENWDGSQWVSYTKLTHEFNSNDEVTLALNQSWDLIGSEWVNDLRSIIEYDNSPNETISITQRWDGMNWQNTSRSTSLDNSRDNIVFSLSEVWDTTTVAWEGIIRTFFHYNNTTTDVTGLETTSFDIQIAPNPSPGAFSIRLPDHSSDMTIEVYTLMGQLLERQAISNGAKTERLNLSHLPVGHYALRLVTGTKTVSKTVQVLR